MTREEVEQYDEKKIYVALTDGKTFKGIMHGVESKFDSSSGDDEIDLYTGKAYVGLPVSEIESIKVIG